jgi:tetraacyldisaccharide 4'-kinase
VIALAKLMKREGVGIDVLSRGYGRSDAGVARVDAAGSAEKFGDEPLLIAREAHVPVYVGALRWEAGRLAELQRTEAGNKVHLLDDGFQHCQLHRDADIVLVSSADLDDWLLPAGNRREPLSALRRATSFAVVEEDEAAHDVTAQLRRMGLVPDFGRPVWRYRRSMVVPEVAGPVVAFCGIARPGQFFAGLEAAGVTVAGRKAFPDHHRFVEGDLADLRKLALASDAAGVVTTAKDAVRLGSRSEELGLPLAIADLCVTFVDEPAVVKELLGWRGLVR